MKLIVISDAHGKAKRITKAVNETLDADYLFYLGDKVVDLQKAKANFNTNPTIVYVKGNRDFSCQAAIEETTVVEGKKIFLTHGHKYSLKWGKNKLYYRSQEIGADIVLFGHTHIRYAKVEKGTLFFNPGSISLPRDQKPASYGVVEIKNDRIEYEHKNI